MMVDYLVHKLTIEGCLKELKNEQWKDWSFKYLDILKSRGFDEAPSSCKLHHSTKGGLREHTEEMLYIADVIKKECGFDKVDEDELVISIVFHDGGKADLYMLDATGNYTHNPNSRATTIDHACIPIFDWYDLGFEFSKNIQDAILGHMGGWSVTGVYPDTLLASIVSSADLISSRLGKTG